MTAFYVKGTDNKVRTSKYNTYTHAVIGGAHVSCHGSLKLAENKLAQIKAEELARAAKYQKELDQGWEATWHFYVRDREILGDAEWTNTKSYRKPKAGEWLKVKLDENDINWLTKEVARINDFLNALCIVELEARVK